MTNHKDLDVWKASMELAKEVYALTSNFPKEKSFGLTSQMRRCAVSIPSNIAEGAARNSSKEFVRFLSISQGSLAELETQLLLSKEFGYLPNEELFPKIDPIRKMLIGLSKYHLKSHHASPVTRHAQP